MITCPKCSGDVEASQLTVPSRGQAVIATLKDWRVWALAFALGGVGAIISGALGYAGLGGGAMGGVGFFAAILMGRMRKCPKCEKVVPFKLEASTGDSRRA